MKLFKLFYIIRKRFKQKGYKLYTMYFKKVFKLFGTSKSEHSICFEFVNDVDNHIRVEIYMMYFKPYSLWVDGTQENGAKVRVEDVYLKILKLMDEIEQKEKDTYLDIYNDKCLLREYLVNYEAQEYYLYNFCKVGEKIDYMYKFGITL